jgi:hypothetical protein
MNKALTSLVVDLTASSTRLMEAKKALTIANLNLAKVERVLAENRNTAIVEGKASGSNESQRNASLAMLLVEETKTVEIASDDVVMAKLNVELATIENTTVKYCITALTAKED